MAVHTSTARNFAAATENKIHSDEIARRFGFTGALVPGVTVFGHLAWPLTERFGAQWLERGWVTTRFLKPAYDGDAITLTDTLIAGGRAAVECRNAADVLLATPECAVEPAQPGVDPRAFVAGPPGPPARVEIAWDSVHVDEPFACYMWQPDAAHNRESERDWIRLLRSCSTKQAARCGKQGPFPRVSAAGMRPARVSALT